MTEKEKSRITLGFLNRDKYTMMSLTSNKSIIKNKRKQKDFLIICTQISQELNQKSMLLLNSDQAVFHLFTCTFVFLSPTYPS
jgi:hypothetical protein